jgi:cytochrome c biogenesis protein CcmG/thiol:disulfide interchange protein DsbE
MKKTVVILLTVVALLVAVFLADRATRLDSKGGKSSTANGASGPAPDFTLRTIEDANATLSQYKGKVVLVNFWATWCDPCREEIPWLIEFQEKYGPRGFVVLGIAMDDEGKSVVAPYIAKERFSVGGKSVPINYPILLGNEDVARKYGGLIGFPTSFLIGRDGRIAKRIIGQLHYDDINQSIQALL